MAETTNYGLYVTETADDPTFKTWREKMSAADDSNMTKIDQALATLNADIQAAEIELNYHAHNELGLNPACIDFNPPSNVSNGGYIDFNYGGLTDNHTSRIIESDPGLISITASDGVILNGSKIPNGHKVFSGLAVYSTAVNFVDGIGRYPAEGTNSIITKGSVAIVQRRSGDTENRTFYQFNTHSYDGYLTIITQNGLGTEESPTTLSLNIIVIT